MDKKYISVVFIFITVLGGAQTTYTLTCKSLREITIMKL